MITEIRNFLSKKDCDYFIKLIDSNNQKSSVSSNGKERSTISDFRTSKTSNLSNTEEVVTKLKNKISKKIKLDIERGEDLQGQLYESGEYFRPHHDYFSGMSYINHCLASGNRVKTVMIYLNDDFEGGETDFPKLGKKIKPEKGKAVIWDDMLDGNVVEDSLHEGTDVIKGKKYIITSWWRENKWDPNKDSELAIKHHESENESMNTQEITSVHNTINFKSKDDLPKVSPLGFKVIKCPEKVWGLIQDAYRLLLNTPQHESWEGMEHFINGNETPIELFSFDNLVSMREIIHDALKPVHEDFAKTELEKTMLYGIRSYTKNAVLKTHVDRIETHHVSSIIIVDKDLACGCSKTKQVANDWPLDIQDHSGNWHKVYAEIGDIILYESATCMHGREEPFKGNYFRNFYVHYKFKNYNFQP